MDYFIQTRVIPPKLPPRIIHREKLISRLGQNSQGKLTLICAPAGYGKTTLIQDYLSVNKVTYSWFYVHEDIDSFYTFIIYLTHSLNQLNKEFGKNTLQVVERSKQR